jgi:photosystem II stability/assembly factor-like uncharacterized protein
MIPPGCGRPFERRAAIATADRSMMIKHNASLIGKIVFLTIFLTIIVLAGFSQQNKWIATGGPLGGIGYDIRMDPRNPDIMYVTDANTGVFKSTDGGRSWFTTNQGIQVQRGQKDQHVPVFSLTIDPNNPDTIWVGLQFSRGVFRNDGAGKTWKEMTNGIKEEAPSVRGFSVEPGNSDVVYMAAEISSFEWADEPRPGLGLDQTKGVVYKTTDGGKNWKRIWYGDNLARYIWIHPEDTDLIYVSTGIFDREAANSSPERRDPGGVGILRSYDGGESWEVLDDDNGFDSDDLYIGSLYMHPEDPETLLAAAGNDPYTTYLDRPMGGVYITHDGGDTWKEVINGPNFSAVEISELDPDIMYAASANSFYRSEDGGDTWKQLSDGLWGPPGIIAGFPIDMQCDPRDSSRIFVNNYGGGNFLSSDGGKTWSNASRGYTGALMRDLSVYPKNPDIVYGSVGSQGVILEGFVDENSRPSGIIVSKDGGKSWEESGLKRGAVVDFEIDPKNPRIITAAMTNGDIMQSSDGGRNFRKLNYRSLYNQLPPPPDPDMPKPRLASIAVHPRNPREMIVGFFGAPCLKTTDGGRNWSPAGRGMPAEITVKALLYNPARPNIVYAGTRHFGVFKSTDGGNNWRPINEGLTRHVVDHLDISADGKVLYAGTEGAGVFRLNNADR